MSRAGAIVLLLLACCRGHVTYTALGDVLTIDDDRLHVTVRHDDIPGLMGAMTMRFAVASPAVLAGVAPGSHIRFTLRQEDEGLVVTAVTAVPDAQGSGGNPDTSHAVAGSPPLAAS